MEQKINIAEKLKDAPDETKLYTEVWGYVKYDRYESNSERIHITIDGGGGKILDQNGCLTRYDLTAYANSECILFPSKDCCSWENFKAPWLHKHFEPFQKVLVNKEGLSYWYADLYSHYRPENCVLHHACVGGGAYSDDEILPYEGNENLLGKGVE